MVIHLLSRLTGLAGAFSTFNMSSIITCIVLQILNLFIFFINKILLIGNLLLQSIHPVIQ